ncbi:MAG: hypothetical protein VW338_12845 [Rhodospirillaceae bacterium]
MRLRGVATILLAGMVALGGCGGDARPVTESAAPPAAEPDAAANAVGTIPPLEAERWPSSAPARRPAEQPVPALSSLAGVDDMRVLSLLGAPHFRRTDAPAELWQYRLNGCVLDLFLYPASGGGLTVDHLSTRSLTGGVQSKGADGQACFAAMVRAARAAAS